MTGRSLRNLDSKGSAADLMPPLVDLQGAWQDTIPHRVLPSEEERLAGVLLRCDEANHWSSGTTFRMMIRATRLPVFGPGSPLMIIPWPVLDYFAQLLQLPHSLLLATTYEPDVIRLYPHCRSHPDVRYLTGTQEATWIALFPKTGKMRTRPINNFGFQVCPVCLKQKRLLTRPLLLPHLHSCPWHHVALQKDCTCGAALLPFLKETLPFTCHNCGLDWANLPQVPLSPGQLALEREMYTFYEMFFQRGTPELLARALSLARCRVRRHYEQTKKPLNGRTRMISPSNMGGSSLAYAVELLVNVGLTPNDILHAEKTELS